METKDVWKSVIEREKSLMPPPGFAESIMARIREEGWRRRNRLMLKSNLLQISAIAASIAVAAIAGVAAGRCYHDQAEGLVINDTQIERLFVYTEYINE